jgi:nickel transport system substrate-binding protein
LARDDYNAAMVAGDFNLAFTETYGAPYDPHSYATSWFSPDEAYYAALKGLKAPNTVDVLEAKVDAVQLLEGEQERQDGWKEVRKIAVAKIEVA